MKNVILFVMLIAIVSVSCAQKSEWNGKKCAVVLTYDDGLNEHLINAIPSLDSLGLKGTFYLAAIKDDQVPAWRAAAASGHELGNHTLYHPCESGRPGREFVTPENDMRNYTVNRIVDEIKQMNARLFAIDGKTRRTFAYPCGDMNVNDTAYIEGLKDEFTGARGVNFLITPKSEIDLYNVNSYVGNGQSGEELIAQVKQAMEKKGLLVFLFHGVGGGHGLNVSLEAHRQLVQFLKQHEKEIWVTPLVDVTTYIRK